MAALAGGLSVERMKRTLLLALVLSCAHPKAEGITSESLRDLQGKLAPVAVAGKVVLLDFWATWCEPCKTALPTYSKLYGDLRARGFEVVAVSVDDDDADVKAFLAARPLPFTVLRDPGGAFAERMGVSLMPTSFLLGKDGKVVSRHDGFDGDTEAALRKQIAAIIGP